MHHVQITEMRVHRIKVPVKAVHSHGSGDVDSINAVVLELQSEDGKTGWGEASPWPVFTGTCEAAAAALDVHLRPLIVGADALRREQLMQQADRTIVGCNEAKAALEMTLLDLASKSLGLSASQFLGGRQRDHVPVSFTVANPISKKTLKSFSISMVSAFASSS